jgi:1-pyrroline-5-carboxylate dehydrogenase
MFLPLPGPISPQPSGRRYAVIWSGSAVDKNGRTGDFTNFINAVIDEESFDKLAGKIAEAQQSPMPK